MPALPDSDVLACSVADGVATVLLDRPERRNALALPFFEDLPRLLEALGASDDVRCVVLAANGPHFCVGLDLNALAAPSPGEAGDRSPVHQHRELHASIGRMQRAVTALAECPVPVVAAVHGYCIGGGVDLITACDVRICADDAVFSVRETKMAIVADLGSLQRLPRIVGPGHAAELAYTGKDIDAARASTIGLVTDVVPGGAEGVRSAALSMAGEIAANSPLAVRGTKAVLAANDGRTVAEGLEFVRWWNAAYLRSDDLREAVTAFFEKRPPSFTGR